MLNELKKLIEETSLADTIRFAKKMDDPDGFLRLWVSLSDKLLEFDSKCSVVLFAYPNDLKIPVIKGLRTIADLGLKEAKDLSENLPAVVLKGLTREKAESAISTFKNVLSFHAEEVKIDIKVEG